MTWNDPDRGKTRSRQRRVPRLLQRYPGRTLAVAALLLLAAWAASGLYQVGAGEAAWVVRLGVPAGPAGPGLHWCLPWPLAHVERVRTDRDRVLEIGFRGTPDNPVPRESRMLTQDGQLLDVAGTVEYTVSNAGNWLFNTRAPEDRVKAAAEDALRATVADSPAAAVLTGTTVAQRARSAAQAMLDREAVGAHIQSIRLVAVQPPAAVEAAREAAAVAAQDRQRLPDAARAAQTQALDQARAAAAQQAVTAQRQAAQTVAAAQTDAAAFNTALADWRKNPSYGHDQLYLDTLRDVLAHAPHVVVDLTTTHHGPLVVKLPAPATPSTPDTPAPAAGATDTPPIPSDLQTDWRSRDSMRSRDREYR